MKLTEGFLLGLSTGTVCWAYCGPVIIPFLLGEGKGTKQNSYSLFLFLTGRFIAYLIFGFLAGLLGKTIVQPSKIPVSIFGIIYILLAVLLVLYGFYRFKEVCLGHTQRSVNSYLQKHFSQIVPLMSGLFTGLNICPPFLLAITKASESGNIGNCILFFAMFFIGSTLYFIPLPLIGFFKRQQVLKVIGKFAAVLTGIIFLYQGIIMILTN